MKIRVSYRDDSLVFWENRPILRMPDIGSIAVLRERWSHRGQGHTPGHMFFKSVGKHVYYESFLESQILLHLDYCNDVKNIAAQPFLLQSDTKNHIPDFLVQWKDGAHTIVNVKPTVFLEKESNQQAFALADEAANQLGWSHKIFTELNPFYIDNLRFLTCYHRLPLLYEQITDEIFPKLSSPMAFGDLVKSVNASPLLVKPVIFHLLWYQKLFTDLLQQFDEKMLVWAGDNA